MWEKHWSRLWNWDIIECLFGVAIKASVPHTMSQGQFFHSNFLYVMALSP